MNGSTLQRREVLLAVSGAYVTFAGCTTSEATISGYGTTYGRGYGGE
ncbi:hypothetical protein [Natrinema soli]|uniref:Uncharacterized protein n=1 Tax=Natrinema soli TaxID=1930624 RepID=A0ABD5STJ8_9EURY|nr:hypothetical protein [Natrinema soli]